MKLVATLLIAYLIHISQEVVPFVKRWFDPHCEMLYNRMGSRGRFCVGNIYPGPFTYHRVRGLCSDIRIIDLEYKCEDAVKYFLKECRVCLC